MGEVRNNKFCFHDLWLENTKYLTIQNIWKITGSYRPNIIQKFKRFHTYAKKLSNVNVQNMSEI